MPDHKRNNEVSFRIPVVDAYVAAIGRATYNFAYLEWGIVWINECLNPGSINNVGKLTAGQIAKQAVEIVQALPESNANREDLCELAERFTGLVKRRDALLHGKPYTADGGEQRLRYSGRHGDEDWDIPTIIEAALEFERAAIDANAFLHERGLLANHAR